MATCMVACAFLCLFLGFIACGVGFFSPFWIYTVSEDSFEGLWGRCRDLTQDLLNENEEDEARLRCVWFFEENFRWEKLKPTWFQACQILDAFGIVTLFAILFVASCHVCCVCCKESINLLRMMGTVLLLGALMLAAALGLYAAMLWKVEQTSASDSQNSRYSWGFYVGIPGVFLTSLSAILYYIESCRYHGYEHGRNEIV